MQELLSNQYDYNNDNDRVKVYTVNKLTGGVISSFVKINSLRN